MATTYEGSITQLSLSADRRTVSLSATYRLFDSGTPAVTLRTVPTEFSYPTLPLRGLTIGQIRALLLNAGAGSTPSLRSVGRTLVEQYDEDAAADPVGSVPLPIAFTDSTP